MPDNRPMNTIPRLIAARVDYYGEHEPQRSYASVPLTDRLEDGYREITYQMLASAVDRAAWWLDSMLPIAQGSTPPQTFAYFGPNDLRYTILALAGIKTNRKILLPSPWRSIENLLHLFDVTMCHHFLCTALPKRNSQLGELQARRSDIRQIIAPSLDDWLDAEGVNKYEYSKNEESAMDDPVIVLHTSGTRGNPKPVTYTNGVLAYFDALRYLSTQNPPLIFSSLMGKRVWCPFPLFHTGGLAWGLLFPLYFGMTSVFGPICCPVSAEIVEQVIEYGHPKGLIMAPYLLLEMSRKASCLASLSKLEFIQQGSAALLPSVGNLLSQRTRLSTIYGATELTFPPILALDPEDWGFVSFHTRSGARFTRHPSNLFELSFDRSANIDYKGNLDVDKLLRSPVFSIFPHLDQYRTRDLWEPHPTKPGLWRLRSRTDDIIVLADGHNLDTTALQLAVQEHPLIRTAIVGGHGRSRSFLMLELNQENTELSQDHQKQIQQLFRSAVEAGNDLYAATAPPISQDFVIIASPDRPFVRVPKGSVDKARTFELYRKEIEQSYFLEDLSTKDECPLKGKDSLFVPKKSEAQ